MRDARQPAAWEPPLLDFVTETSYRSEQYASRSIRVTAPSNNNIILYLIKVSIRNTLALYVVGLVLFRVPDVVWLAHSPNKKTLKNVRIFSCNQMPDMLYFINVKSLDAADFYHPLKIIENLKMNNRGNHPVSTFDD